MERIFPKAVVAPSNEEEAIRLCEFVASHGVHFVDWDNDHDAYYSFSDQTCYDMGDTDEYDQMRYTDRSWYEDRIQEIEAGDDTDDVDWYPDDPQLLFCSVDFFIGYVGGYDDEIEISEEQLSSIL